MSQARTLGQGEGKKQRYRIWGRCLNWVRKEYIVFMGRLSEYQTHLGFLLLSKASNALP